MITVNLDETESRLAELVTTVEVTVLSRGGIEVAEIRRGGKSPVSRNKNPVVSWPPVERRVLSSAIS